MNEPRALGPKQLEYCRATFPIFSIAEKQAQAALEDTRLYRDKYLIHERKQ